MFKVTTLTIALLMCLHSYAQVEPIYSNYQHYTTEDGLPQNYVSYLAQDQDGFIWVATLNGLARFDGYEFLRFNSIATDSNTISTSRIIDVLIDDENNLWILNFNNKVDRMNPRTFQVSRDVNPVKSIQDTLFSLNTGPPGSKFVYFVSDNAKKNWFVKDERMYHLIDSALTNLSEVFIERDSSEVGYGFDIDESGKLWFMTKEGLEVSQNPGGAVKKVLIPKEFNYNPGPRNKCPVVCLPDNRVFFAYENRIFIYDEMKEVFRELEVPKVPIVNSAKIFNVVKDNQNRPIFQYQGYIFRMERNEEITPLWVFPEREKLLIAGMLVDRSNTLWVGINTGGLYRINTLTPSFNNMEYDQNFLVDLLVNELAIEADQLPQNWMQKKGSYDFRYHYSPSGRLYFCQDGYYFGKNNRIFYLDGMQVELIKAVPSTRYFKGFYESEGALKAIDTHGHTYQWDDLSTNPNIKENEIGDDEYYNLMDYVEADGYAWALDAENKIHQFEEGKIIRTFEVGDKDFELITLQKDQKDSDIFWIATYGGGLLKWDFRTHKVEKVFTKNEGLPDNTIAAMIPDENGNIWMSTFNGVSKFDPESERFTNYSTSDGLIQSEFDRHHGFKLPDGRIAFGAAQGYSVFDPSLFVEDKFNPEIKIAHLFINNKEQFLGDSLSLITQPLNQLEKLILDYQNNSIALEIMANQFNNPDKMAYRYKLSGYHTDWVHNKENRKIQFDKLRTGTYSLSLNASNTNGIWSKHVRELQIQVLPPPWLSWWAYASYVVIGSLLVFLYWRNYRRKLIRKQEEEFTRREAIRLKEVDDMKTRFFSNITHEFRTPLTLILSPLEKQLRDKKYPMEVQTILESNYRHGSHLLKLVNELLDISKLEGGFMQMHKSTGELNTFLKECVGDFSELAQQKGIDLTFDSKNISGYHQFDKNHLEKVVLNLLSNAIKFTDQNGKVGLSAEVIEDERLVVAVHDSGIGIPNEQLPKLFDRFYQVDDTATRAYEGTGIGLSLVKELIDLMEGSISVESNIGKGSIFKVSIPITKVSASPEPPFPMTKNDAVELPGGSPVILVVEDNAELRSFIVESLSKESEVLEASNGKQGWDLILDRLPDVVVSDVMMPEMNGYELCLQSKTDTRTSHINFILLTAKTAQESKEKGLESGADDYLTKPFHMYELELRIQNLLQHQANLRDHLRKEFLSLKSEEQTPEVKNVFLRQLYEILEGSMSNKNVSVDWLATEMAMSQSTINRKLKSLLGLSAVEFIKQTRLKKSIELLNTGMSISNIAYQVGFESPSYFSQCFKEVYNVSPSDYQKEAV